MDERELEHAERVAQSEIEEGIRKVLAKNKAPDPDFDGLCIECGDEIPAKRIALGATTCVSCQSDIEHRNKQYRK
jgi:RNA polymerase-binding transcription factor DksA